MSTEQMLEMADALATELLELGRRRGMGTHDVLMLVALTERLLQKVTVLDDVHQIRAAIEEADATFKAVTGTLEAH
jgi:hypothetical protein